MGANQNHLRTNHLRSEGETSLSRVLHEGHLNTFIMYNNEHTMAPVGHDSDPEDDGLQHPFVLIR